MKIYIFFGLFLFLTSHLYSQDVVNLFDTTKYEASSVVEIDSVNKDEIYSRVKYWIGTTYNSASKVIDLDDKSTEIYQIILKPLMEKHCVYIKGFNEFTVFVSYTVIIRVKDNRVKIEMKDFYCKGTGQEYEEGYLVRKDRGKLKWGTMPEKCWIKLRKDCKKECIKLMVNFENSIKKSSVEVEDDF